MASPGAQSRVTGPMPAQGGNMMRTRDTIARRMALAGALLLGGAMVLAAAPARAGATIEPAFQNRLTGDCNGATGGTPAGSAVIGLTGSAKNPVVHGTAHL